MFLYYIRLPEKIMTAINLKLEANQRASQRENELREEQAAAQKSIAKADGEAQSILKVAKAQAEANRLLNASITANLIEYEKWKKWDGKMPMATGGTQILDLRTK
jgi:regulator of protease activity HflC (stomatin/prohibitin superfamily)